MSRHILLTGFDPFAGETCNPSMTLARALDGHMLGSLQIVVQNLPCDFACAPQVLNDALSRWSPVLVLALGQAAGRADLSLERVAINLVDARIPDNAGQQPIDLAVVPGGPAAYFTSLPIKAMVAAIRAAGVPASVSHSAGTFVCNQVFYALQHRLARTPGAALSDQDAVRSGFMHLPLLPEQAAAHPGQPSMALQTMLVGVRAALAAALAPGLADRGESHRVSEGSMH